MTLYSSFLSMAPFILLAVTAGAFGPWGRAADEGWSYAFLWDVALVLIVIAGGIVSVLVLGDVVSESEITQDLVVVAGCVSLSLLATHVLVSVISLYRSHRDDLADEETKEHAGALGRASTASHEGDGRPADARTTTGSDPRQGAGGAVESGGVSHTEPEGADSVGDALGPR